jgi:hypothetical protein
VIQPFSHRIDPARTIRWAISLSQFEKIDGLLLSLLRAGPFETCADPRGYISTSNRLDDACIDAMGYSWVNDFASAEEAAAAIATLALTSRDFVTDEVSA